MRVSRRTLSRLMILHRTGSSPFHSARSSGIPFQPNPPSPPVDAGNARLCPWRNQIRFACLEKHSPQLLFLVCLAGAAFAQGLGGPSSVQADLQPGDGLTDPQFRSDFPVNIAPGYFRWKEGLAENGFSFNLDYLSLGQWSDSDLGRGERIRWHLQILRELEGN